MKCISCGSNTYESLTTDVTEFERIIIIIRHTPCHKCIECNEIIYTADVINRLNSIIDNFKQSINEINIFNYENIVA